MKKEKKYCLFCCGLLLFTVEYNFEFHAVIGIINIIFLCYVCHFNIPMNIIGVVQTASAVQARYCFGWYA